MSEPELELEPDPEHQVTPLELFFDLVFVFAITQVTSFLAHEPTWGGVFRGMLVLSALWWAWTTYAWLTSAMDVYLSTVSNRLNAVTKQLAVIATVFLPLTFITGFFGQNFGWMVGHITSGPVFLGLGIGSELVALVILLAFFKRRGWF